MNIFCTICQDLLIQSETEDILFISCGHVFHRHCILRWLERAKTCPQCRATATENRIHKAHFTFSNPEPTDNVDISSLQGRIDSLQFQILLNEKNIKHYTSKNVILEKQNAGLRQEIRKVESQINQKTAIVYDIKKERDHFKYNCMFLEKKLFEKKREVEQIRNMCKTLSTNMLENVQKMVRKVTDRNTLITYIAILKNITLEKRRKIENLQNELTRNQQFLEESFTNVELELKLTFYKSEDLFLQHRIIELEKLLKIISDQNYVTKSISRRNSNENLINVQTETADQSDSSKTKVEIIDDTNQENYMNSNSTIEECPTVRKKARVCLRSGNSDKTNYAIMNDVKNTQK